MLRQHELSLLRFLLWEIERHFINHRGKDSFTMSVVTTNDQAVRLRPAGLDRDGVAVSFGALQVSVDKPDVATVAPDPDVPGAYLLTSLPATDPAVGARTVVVTTTDPATGVSVQTSVEFDPGAETSLTVAAEVVPLPASGPQSAVAAQQQNGGG